MKLKKLIIYTVFVSLMITGICFSANAKPLENVLSVGGGLPYGGIGMNYELGINDYLATTIGAGYLPENVGWNAGLRLYYPGRNYIFRGRLTALYGTNTLLQKKAPENDYETETGISAGIGFDWRFSEHWALCGDVFLADTETPEGYDEKNNDVFIAIGISLRW